jgi:hypothetical protein
MPSTSKAQQKLMGMAYALKKGDMDPKDASQEVKDLADSMTLQQLKDFASTEHEGLPDYVKEGEDHEVGMAMSQLNAISKAVGELLQKIGREEKDLPGWLQDHISQSYNYIKQANDGYYEVDEMVSPESIGGMGATALPSATSIGSGDVPNFGRDDKEDEEEEKKRRKEFLKRFKSFEDFIKESEQKIIDYSNSKNKILVGLKTDLLRNMKERYESKEDGDNIYFFDKSGNHFGTLFDLGSRYQELRHNGKLDDYGYLKESNSNNEVEMILSKDQDFDDVKRLLITDKKANNLNFTHWSHGQPLGSIRGHLITMYFYNTKDEVTSFIQRNDIKIANKSNFNLD